MAKKGTKPAGNRGALDQANLADPRQIEEAASDKKEPLVIVGIGASAGGLSSFRRFIAGLPDNPGIAFVLIQHLDPTHKSLTAELLASYTKMKVEQVNRDISVEVNHVYVIPPNRYLEMRGDSLVLSEPTTRTGVRTPIDFFLRSLAVNQQARSIGVVLSGTGTDGTLGACEIKGAGGMNMAESPESAEFDGMPRSVIASGVVDYVLPVEEMPAALMGYVAHGYVNQPIDSDGHAAEVIDDISTVIALLRARLKKDFGFYKKGTLTRRVQRRMGLCNISELTTYIDVLRNDDKEIKALFKDLLIGVTNFFREPEAWDELEKLVIEPIINSIPKSRSISDLPARNHVLRNNDEGIRIWVPGCSTGEEAYSIAMVIREKLEEADKACLVQIFASDIDQDSLAIARSGIYPENIAADVDPDRLQRFFTKGEHSYRINKNIREMVVFAEQHLVSDPPFSKLDLISCRNLLIYLEPEIQRKVLQLFHFSLKNEGFLFLGNAETVGQQPELFTALSSKWRIYQRLTQAQARRLELPVIQMTHSLPELPISIDRQDLATRRLVSYAQQAVMRRFAPACVLINHRLDVLFLHGPIDDYLKLPLGEFASDLIAMARTGLRTRLRAAIDKAIGENGPVVAEDVRVKHGEQYFSVNISVEPVPDSYGADNLLLIAFEESSVDRHVRIIYVDPPAEDVKDKANSTREYEALLKHLEEELTDTREDLQSTIEELETSNEEFKAANEEVTSINEELQSTNEELESSKEELQSLNEELQTVNGQLEAKVFELEGTTNDLSNLLKSIDHPTIFLDRAFRIKRFTPSATKLMRLIDYDIGRPVADIAQNMADQVLLEDAGIVLNELSRKEREVRDHQGSWYLRRIVPYRTEDDRIEGIVITFTDITERKKHEENLKEMNEQLEKSVRKRTADLELANAALTVAEAEARALFDHAGMGLFQVDAKTDRFLHVNEGLSELTGYSKDELLDMTYQQLCIDGDAIGSIVDVLEGTPADDQPIPWVQHRARCKDGSILSVAANAVELPSIAMSGEGSSRIVALFADITDFKEMERRMVNLANDERERMGRDLHDRISQQLSGLGLLTAALKKELDGGLSEAARGMIGRMENHLLEAQTQVRTMVTGLYSDEVKPENLKKVLEGLAHEIGYLYQVPCLLDFEQGVEIKDAFTAGHLYLLIREASINAARHAKPEKITITLAPESDGIRVVVADDGIGMPDVVNPLSRGRQIMRTRAELIGAGFEISSKPGEGTRITCQLKNKVHTGK